MTDEEAADIYEHALEKIAAGKRQDGTYNRSREACGQVARDALELVRQRTSSDAVPAHDECICGKINARHCPVHQDSIVHSGRIIHGDATEEAWENASPIGSLASDKAEIRKLRARVEVELDLRKAAYERIGDLESAIEVALGDLDDPTDCRSFHSQHPERFAEDCAVCVLRAALIPF